MKEKYFGEQTIKDDIAKAENNRKEKSNITQCKGTHEMDQHILCS